MNRLSWPLILAGTIAFVTPVHAGSPQDNIPLIDKTAPGFRYPGPFNDSDSFVIYQKPAGHFVWNGKWFVYHDPYSSYGHPLRRSY